MNLGIFFSTSFFIHNTNAFNLSILTLDLIQSKNCNNNRHLAICEPRLNRLTRRLKKKSRRKIAGAFQSTPKSLSLRLIEFLYFRHLDETPHSPSPFIYTNHQPPTTNHHHPSRVALEDIALLPPSPSCSVNSVTALCGQGR
jgi:hypothetical protein